MLFEQVEPGAWFDRLFGPFGGEGRNPVAPPAVLDARRDFADILFRDEIDRALT